MAFYKATTIVHALCTHQGQCGASLVPLIVIFSAATDQRRPAHDIMRPLHGPGRASWYPLKSFPFFLKKRAPSKPSKSSKLQRPSALLKGGGPVRCRPSPSEKRIPQLVAASGFANGVAKGFSGLRFQRVVILDQSENESP